MNHHDDSLDAACYASYIWKEIKRRQLDMDTVNYGTIRCKICNHSFEPDVKKHYVARDAGKTGFGAAFSSNDEPKQYDAFDCPRCGCQCRLQERVRTVEPVTPPDDEEALDLMDKATIDNYLGLKDGAAEALRQAKIDGKPIVIVANCRAVDENLIWEHGIYEHCV